MSFEAKYHGDCAAGDHITPGDVVAYDEDGALLHTNCTLRDQPGSSDVCTQCHMVHAGECL